MRNLGDAVLDTLTAILIIAFVVLAFIYILNTPLGK